MRKSTLKGNLNKLLIAVAALFVAAVLFVLPGSADGGGGENVAEALASIGTFGDITTLNNEKMKDLPFVANSVIGKKYEVLGIAYGNAGKSNSSFSSGLVRLSFDAEGTWGGTFDSGGSAQGKTFRGALTLQITPNSELARQIDTGRITYRSDSIFTSGGMDPTTAIAFSNSYINIDNDTAKNSLFFGLNAAASNSTKPANGGTMTIGSESELSNAFIPVGTRYIYFLFEGYCTQEGNSTQISFKPSLTLTADDGALPEVKSLFSTAGENALITAAAQAATPYEPATRLDTYRPADNIYEFRAYRNQPIVFDEFVVEDSYAAPFDASRFLGLYSMTFGSSRGMPYTLNFTAESLAALQTNPGIIYGKTTGSDGKDIADTSRILCKIEYVDLSVENSGSVSLYRGITLKITVYENNGLQSLTVSDVSGKSNTRTFIVNGILNQEPTAYDEVIWRGSSGGDKAVVGPVYYEGGVITAIGSTPYGADATSQTAARNAIDSLLEAAPWINQSSAQFYFGGGAGQNAVTIYRYQINSGRTYTYSTGYGTYWRTETGKAVEKTENLSALPGGYVTITTDVLDYAGNRGKPVFFFFKLDYSVPYGTVSSAERFNSTGILQGPYTYGSWTGDMVEISMYVGSAPSGVRVYSSVSQSGNDPNYLQPSYYDSWATLPGNRLDAAGFYYSNDGTISFNIRLSEHKNNAGTYAEYDNPLYFFVETGAGGDAELSEDGRTVRIDRNAPTMINTNDFDDFLNKTGDVRWMTEIGYELDGLGNPRLDKWVLKNVQLEGYDDDHADDTDANVSIYYSIHGTVGVGTGRYIRLDARDIAANGGLIDVRLGYNEIDILKAGCITLNFWIIDQAGNVTSTPAYNILIDPNIYRVEFSASDFNGLAANAVITLTENSSGRDIEIKSYQALGSIRYYAEFYRGEVGLLSVRPYTGYAVYGYNREGEFNAADLVVSVGSGQTQIAGERFFEVNIDEGNYDNRGNMPFQWHAYADDRNGKVFYEFLVKRLIGITVQGLNVDYNGNIQTPSVATSVTVPSDTVQISYYTTYLGGDGKYYELDTVAVPRNAGVYIVKVICDPNNAVYTAVPAEALFTIEKGNIYVTATAVTRPYNGNTPNFGGGGFTYTGNVTEVTHYFGSVALAKAGAKDVGTYRIVEYLTFDFRETSDYYAQNYNVFFTEADYIITPYQISLTEGTSINQIDPVKLAQSATYDGFGHSVKYNTDDYILIMGLSGEYLNVYFAQDGVDAGMYPIYIKNVQPVNDYTLVANYAISIANTRYFTVLKKSLRIRPEYAYKIYGDQDPVCGYTIETSDLIAGDLPAIVTAVRFMRESGADVGFYAYVDVEASLISENYELTPDFDAARFEIKARDITVIPYSGQVLIDGTDYVIDFYYTGYPSSATDKNIFTGTLDFLETSSNVFEIVVGTLDAPNFNITFIDGVTVIVVSLGAFEFYFQSENFENIYGKVPDAASFIPKMDDWQSFADDYGIVWYFKGFESAAFEDLFGSIDDLIALYPAGPGEFFSFFLDASIEQFTAVGYYSGMGTLRFTLPVASALLEGVGIFDAYFDMPINVSVKHSEITLELFVSKIYGTAFDGLTVSTNTPLPENALIQIYMIEELAALFESGRFGITFSVTAPAAAGKYVSIGSYPLVLSAEARVYDYDNGVYVDSIIVRFSASAAISVAPAKILISVDGSTLTKAYGADEAPINYTVSGLFTEAGDILRGSFERAYYFNSVRNPIDKYDAVIPAHNTLRFYGLALKERFSAGANYTIEFDLPTLGRLSIGDIDNVLRFGTQDGVLEYIITPLVATVRPDGFFYGVSKVFDGTYEVFPVSGMAVLPSEILTRDRANVSITFTAIYGTGTYGAFVPSAETGIRNMRFSSVALAGSAGANYELYFDDGVTARPLTASDVFYSTITVDGSPISINSLAFTLTGANFAVEDKKYDGTDTVADKKAALKLLNWPAFFEGITNYEVTVLKYAAPGADNAVSLRIELRFVSEYAGYIIHVPDASDPVDVNINDDVITVGYTTVARILRRQIDLSKDVAVTFNDKIYNGTAAVTYGCTFNAGVLASGETLALRINATFANVTVSKNPAGVPVPVEIFISSVEIAESNVAVNYELIGSLKNLLAGDDEDEDRFFAIILPARLAVVFDSSALTYNASSAIDAASAGIGFSLSLTPANISVNRLPYSYKDAKGNTRVLTDETWIFTGTDWLNTILYYDNTVYLTKYIGGALSEYARVNLDANNNLLKHDITVHGLSWYLSGNNEYLNNFVMVAYNGEDGVMHIEQKVAMKSTDGATSQELDNAVVMRLAAELNRRSVTVILNDIKVSNKVYDGTTNAQLTAKALAEAVLGFVPGDDASLDYVATFMSYHAADDINVNFAVRGIKGTSADSYLLTAPISQLSKTTSAGISRALITIQDIFVPNKEFDATTDVKDIGKITYVLSGMVSADIAKGNQLRLNIIKALYNDANVLQTGNPATLYILGSLPFISGTGYIDYMLDLSPDPEGNFYVSMTAGNSKDGKFPVISPKKLTVNITVKPKVYDGTDTINPADVIVALNGMLKGESLTVTVLNAAKYNSYSAGNHKIFVALSPEVLEGGNVNKNYILGTEISISINNVDYPAVAIEGFSGTIEKFELRTYVRSLTASYGSKMFDYGIFETAYVGDKWIELKEYKDEEGKSWWIDAEKYAVDGTIDKIIWISGAMTEPTIYIPSPYDYLTRVGNYSVGLKGGTATDFVFNITQNGSTFNGNETGFLHIVKAVVEVYTEAYTKYYKGANPPVTLLYSGFKNGVNPNVPGSVEGLVKPVVKFALVSADGTFIRNIESGGLDLAGTGDGAGGYYVAYISFNVGSGVVAGAAQYTFVLRGTEQGLVGKDVFAPLTILRSEITGITLEDRVTTYDGTAQSLTVKAANTNLPDLNKIKYRYYRKDEMGDYVLVSEEPLASVVGWDGAGVSLSGKYLVEAYYDADANDDFAAWSRSAILTINQKRLTITVDKVTEYYSGSGISVARAKITNAPELSAAQMESLLNDIVYTYYAGSAKLAYGVLPINAGVYTCVASLSGEYSYSVNYSETSSAPAEIVVTPIYIHVAISQRSFLFDGTTHDLKKYATFSTQAPYNVKNFNEYTVEYSYADSPTTKGRTPSRVNMYVYTFTSDNANFVLTGDNTGLLSISPEEISDSGLLATVKALTSNSIITTTAPTASGGYLSFRTVYERPYVDPDNINQFNRTMRNIWDGAAASLGKRFSVKAVSELFVYKDAVNVENSYGSFEITVSTPVPGAALFMKRADGTFKELAYVDNGDDTVTFVSDALGYFVFATEAPVPLELIIGLSVGGGLLLLLIIVAIILGKRAKRLKLLHKYVDDASAVKKAHHAKRYETIDGQTTYTVVKDYDPEIDDANSFYDPTGE
jgi:hypothetical protein